MKKILLIFSIVFMIGILLFTKRTYGLELKKNLALNSNDLLAYINENNIKNITEFCTTDFCDYIRSSNIEKAIDLFKKKYLKFLTNKKDEQTAIETIIKGFPITKIKTLE